MGLCRPYIYTWYTHTFSCSDVNRAGDVGEALIHAHLQVDHPAKNELMTDVNIWLRNAPTRHAQVRVCLCTRIQGLILCYCQWLPSSVEYTPRSTLSVLAALWAHKHADIDIKAKPLKRSGSSPPTKRISSVWISPRPLLWKPQTAKWLLILQSSLLISAAKTAHRYSRLDRDKRW